MEVKQSQELHVQAVWFAAGTAALMACLERAIVVSFVEQCRVLVFLALNLLLLAILFTSTNTKHTTSSTEEEPAEVKLVVVTKARENIIIVNNFDEEEADADEVDFKSSDNMSIMSKEELNQRAEAFIAMFRQHLASDANFHFSPTPTHQILSS